jgi:ADP-dependent phosphofructokinase/glucokinase
MGNSNQWVMGNDSDEDAVFLENERGIEVVTVGRLHCLDCDHNPIEDEYLTTDEQWQSIVDCIAAAPEMVAVLKGAMLVEYTDRTEVREYLDRVKAVLAKAEPVRKVKVRVTFEVDVMPGRDDHQTFARARDEIVVCGEGKCVDEKFVHPNPAR